MIVVRYILNQAQITWLQVIFVNTLLYPISMSNCLGPECGVFCISIVNLILRSVLVVFSLVSAINYHYNKGPPIMEFFKFKTIQCILVRIYLIQSTLLRQVINIVLFYIILWYTCRGTFSDIVYWPTTILLLFFYVF